MPKRHKLKLDPSRLKLPLFFMVLTLIIDQFTKYLIRTSVEGHTPIRVVEGFFQIVHTRNTGVAFGFLSSFDPAIINPILFAVNILIMSLLFFLILLEDLRAGTKVAFGLILGGAAGNLIDRFFLGSVVDFLDFFIGTIHWPAFNIADAAITVGAILMVADTLKGGRKGRG